MGGEDIVGVTTAAQSRHLTHPLGGHLVSIEDIIATYRRKVREATDEALAALEAWPEDEVRARLGRLLYPPDVRDTDASPADPGSAVDARTRAQAGPTP